MAFPSPQFWIVLLAAAAGLSCLANIALLVATKIQLRTVRAMFMTQLLPPYVNRLKDDDSTPYINVLLPSEHREHWAITAVKALEDTALVHRCEFAYTEAGRGKILSYSRGNRICRCPPTSELDFTLKTHGGADARGPVRIVVSSRVRDDVFTSFDFLV
jgi:hypothetical protein